jgi:hypothetical protein
VAAIDQAPAAERLARAILDDITLYNEERVRNAQDLTQELASEIDEGRELFRARVEPSLHRIFEDELLAWRGRARDHAKRLGGSPLDRGKLAFVVAVVVAFIAVAVWLAMR